MIELILAGQTSFKMACKRTPSHRKRFTKSSRQNKTHPIFFIVILILILHKQNKSKYSHTSQEKTSNNLLYLLYKPYWPVSNKTKKPCINLSHTAAIIYILLLNDIHPNPGPISEVVSLRCESCTGVTITKMTVTEHEKGFEWICPNKNCLPNYHSKPILCNTINQYITTPREEEIHHYQINNEHRSVEPYNLTDAERENLSLLTELTKISPKDYIGLDLCRKCGKKVNENQRAISCDACIRWIHLGCSDVSIKAYNVYKTKKEFAWVCNICRTPDLMPTNELFNAKHCKTEDLPESYKSLKSQIKNSEELFLHLNARSVVNKADDISEICEELHPALILITETWLDGSCPKGTAVPKGYTIVRKDRSEIFKQIYGKSNGGGIAILVREGINLKIHGSLNTDKNELLWCTLQLKGKQYLICLMYRAEYTTLLDINDKGESEIENLLQSTSDYNLIIMGDTNCDTQSSNPTKQTTTLLSLTKEYGLKQLIKKPTRFNKASATTIDHIFTRDDTLIKKAGTCEGISDHCGIYCIINAEKTPNTETKRCRSFKDFNEANYQNDIIDAIMRSAFSQHMQNEDLNKAFDTWINVIKNVSDIHAPWKEFKRTNEIQHIPWYTKELEEIKEQKNRSLQLYRLYRNPEDYEIYKRMKNIQTHLTRTLKRAYYKEKIENFEGDSRKIWQILKDVTNKNYREEVLPDNPNKKTANKFNIFFAKVGKQVQEKLKIKIDMPDLTKSGNFRFENETYEKVDALIKRIRPDVATGCDEISARLLHAARPSIITNIKDMVNLSYKTEVFPDALKKAHVKALHKEGDNNSPSQYRPISILPTISKVFERSASEQLANFLLKNCKLTSKQHAYKKSFSTITCLFEFDECIRAHMDKKDLVAIASLDLSKAFDSLSHELILSKLIKKDVDKTAIKWIKSYLDNRSQCVKFGKTLSDEEKVESGVPQGSILGPLLFITCTDDLSAELNQYETFSYADDTQILVTGKDIEEVQKKLIDAIQTANKYYNTNSLLNNISKTKIMLFQPQDKSKLKNGKILEIKPKDIPQLEKPIVSQDHLKILGIYIDKNLNWNKHISYIKRNATNSIRNLHRANKILPFKQKRILYNSLVVPHFSYGDIIWNCCSKENSRKIQQAQNFAVKSILGLGKRSSSSNALKQLQLLPLEEKRNIHSAVFVKKALDGVGPKGTIDKYNDLKRHEDLRPGKLQIPKHKTTQYEKGPLYTSIKVWNSIPNHFKNLKVNQFKDNIQKYKLKNFLES